MNPCNASSNSSYMPVINAIVQPETPGITSQAPINNHFNQTQKYLIIHKIHKIKFIRKLYLYTKLQQ